MAVLALICTCNVRSVIGMAVPAPICMCCARALRRSCHTSACAMAVLAHVCTCFDHPITCLQRLVAVLSDSMAVSVTRLHVLWVFHHAIACVVAVLSYSMAVAVTRHVLWPFCQTVWHLLHPFACAMAVLAHVCICYGRSCTHPHVLRPSHHTSACVVAVLTDSLAVLFDKMVFVAPICMCYGRLVTRYGHSVGRHGRPFLHRPACTMAVLAYNCMCCSCSVGQYGRLVTRLRMLWPFLHSSACAMALASHLMVILSDILAILSDAVACPCVLRLLQQAPGGLDLCRKISLAVDPTWACNRWYSRPRKIFFLPPTPPPSLAPHEPGPLARHGWGYVGLVQVSPRKSES